MYKTSTMKATILFILCSMFIVSYIRAGAVGSTEFILKKGDIVGAKLSTTFTTGFTCAQKYQNTYMTYKRVIQNDESPFPDNINILAHYIKGQEEYEKLDQLLKNVIGEKRLKVNDVVGAKIPEMMDFKRGIVKPLKDTEITYRMVTQDKKSPFPDLDIIKRYTPEHEDYETYKIKAKKKPEIEIATFKRSNSV